MLNVVMLSVIYVECHKYALNAECCYAEFVMLSVTNKPSMLSAIMLFVVGLIITYAECHLC